MASDVPIIKSLQTPDLDGDGDADLLIAHLYDREGVVWYENKDGRGAFGDPQVISHRWGINTATPVDVDGDGDLDIVTATYTEEGEDDESDTVIWFENIDGSGTFGSERLITRDMIGVISVEGGDIDGDGDQDVVAAGGYYGSRVAWLENLDGKGNFDDLPNVILNHRGVSGQLNIADLDGDDDLDVVGSFSADVITWYENRVMGDAKNDGIFNSADLVKIFQAGEYEDGIQGNSIFDEGDFDGDGDFTTSDLVHVFQAGTFSHAAMHPSQLPAIDSVSTWKTKQLRNGKTLHRSIFRGSRTNEVSTTIQKIK